MHERHSYPSPALRVPWRLLGALAGLLLLIVLFGQLRAALDPLARAEAERQAWRAAQLDSQLATLDLVVAAGWRALPLLLVAGAGVVGLALIYSRWVKPEIVKADKIIALQRAQVQLFPPSLTSLSYTDSSRPLPAPPALPALEAPAPALPGQLDLAALDVRPSIERILLGVDEHGPIHVSVAQLCHVALLGSTGGGKSNLLRLIIPQLQKLGGIVALADPHYAPLDPESGDDWRPIAQRLRFAPAVKAGEIDQLLDFMVEELGRRLEKRNAGQKVGPPLFLCFDELPVIADLVPGAVARIGKLLREGRKCHILTVGASQSMLIKEVGGSSALRDQYRTSFYVGGDRKSAAALLDVAERTIDDGPLGKGLVLLRSEVTKPARLVRVPYASNAAIYALLDRPEGEEHTRPARPFGFQPTDPRNPIESQVKASAETHESSLERGASPDPKHARILTLFGQGKSIGEIVKAIYGEISGPKYNAARAEVEAAIRQALTAVE